MPLAILNIVGRASGSLSLSARPLSSARFPDDSVRIGRDFSTVPARTPPSTCRSINRHSPLSDGTMHLILFIVFRRILPDRSRQSPAADASHQQRAFADCGDDFAGGALSAAWRRVPGSRAGHRLRRRHHGALHLRRHAAECRPRRTHTGQPRSDAPSGSRRSGDSGCDCDGDSATPRAVGDCDA